MKKINGFTVNPNVIWMYPPEPMDADAPIDLAQQVAPPNPYTIADHSSLRRFSGEDTFAMRIGGTTYEVSTHFSTEGNKSVLEQFKNLILSENLI